MASGELFFMGGNKFLIRVFGLFALGWRGCTWGIFLFELVIVTFSMRFFLVAAYCSSVHFAHHASKEGKLQES